MWYVVMAGKGREKIAIEKCRNALSTDAAVNIIVPAYLKQLLMIGVDRVFLD